MASVSVRYIVDDVGAAIASTANSWSPKRSCTPARPSRCRSRRNAASPQRTRRSGRRRPGDARRKKPEPGGSNRFIIESPTSPTGCRYSETEGIISATTSSRGGRRADPAGGSCRQSRRAVRARHPGTRVSSTADDAIARRVTHLTLQSNGTAGGQRNTPRGTTLMTEANRCSANSTIGEWLAVPAGGPLVRGGLAKRVPSGGMLVSRR